MAVKLKSIETAFPTPLITLEVADCDSLNRDLLQEIAVRRAAEEGKDRSNRIGWHSQTDLFQRREKGHSTLAGIILSSIKSVTQNLAPDTDFSELELACDGWVNVSPTGAYNTPHEHPGSYWSGCYYVAVPVEEDGPRHSGAIEFLDPRGSKILSPVRAPFAADKIRIQPTPGMLLIFPSNLKHWVHPNSSKEERVTIAFNARFNRRRGGGRSRS